MKKSLYQITNFLSQHSYKSEQELKRILAICQDEGDISLAPCYEISPDSGIGLMEFLDWNDNYFGAGDICKVEEEMMICGICDFKAATIVGKLSGDKIIISDSKEAQNRLKWPSEEERYNFMCAMMSSGLQFSLKEMKLVEKFVPQPGDRVIFTSTNQSGLGVVRSVHFDTDLVDYFCYYINETEETGYSMHEIGITKLSEVIFEPMNNNASQRQTKGNGIYLQRKLNKVLAKYGKVWNEKLHRIEPLEPLVPIGQRYWYFNDKLELLSDVEAGKMSSRKRYYAANYFKSLQEGMDYMGRIAELLRDRWGLPEEDKN